MKYQVFHEENIMWSELTRIYVSAHRSWDVGHKISHKKGARSSDHWCLQHPRYIQYQWLKFCFVNENKNCWNIVKNSVSYVFLGDSSITPPPVFASPRMLKTMNIWVESAPRDERLVIFRQTNRTKMAKLKSLAQKMKTSDGIWQGKGLLSELNIIMCQWNTVLIKEEQMAAGIMGINLRFKVLDLIWMIINYWRLIHKSWKSFPFNCQNELYLFVLSDKSTAARK